MDVRFYLGSTPSVQLLDEKTSRLYVDDPIPDTSYTRVDVRVIMQHATIQMVGREVGCYTETLHDYERSLYFLPFIEEVVTNDWREDIDWIGKNTHWRLYNVVKVVHGVTLL